MATNIEELKGLLAQAKGKVLESGLRNIEAWIDGDFMPGWAVEALVELFKAGEYGEINDRFFQTLAFGTGGMRGRTIGKVSAKAEIGTPSEQGTPAHAAVDVLRRIIFVGAAPVEVGQIRRCRTALTEYVIEYIEARIFGIRTGRGVPIRTYTAIDEGQGGLDKGMALSFIGRETSYARQCFAKHEMQVRRTVNGDNGFGRLRRTVNPFCQDILPGSCL